MPKTSSRMKIVVSKDGPYLVSGSVPLKVQVITPNSEGFSWEWKDGEKFQAGKEYNLYRCGQSKNKPFCDNSHLRVKFDGKETATRRPYVRQAEVLDGPTLRLSDAEENHLDPAIGVVEDPGLGVSGPLWVQGGIPIESADGTPYEVRNRVTLCRCGVSINKPFCNGRHASIKFRDGLLEHGK